MGEPLYNPNDRLTGRDGGPYLDIVQAQADETIRAKREGREPDLDNPGANAGIQLSTAARLVAAIDVNVPSQTHNTEREAKRMFENAAASDETSMKQWDEIPDPVVEDEDEDEPSLFDEDED